MVFSNDFEHFQDLEKERKYNQGLDTEVRRLTETMEQERARQKQIVLYLLAERRQLIIKWMEERKRSEELSQVIIFLSRFSQ